MTRAAERIIVHPSTEAVAILVAVAHERLAADFANGTPSFDFEDPCWDIRALKDRSTNRAAPRLYFTRYGTTDEILPPQYAMVVKSWLILQRGSAAAMGPKLDSARMLWEAILKRRPGAAGRFRWKDLCTEDLSQAELLMRSRWKSRQRTEALSTLSSSRSSWPPEASVARSTTGPRRRELRISIATQLRAKRNGVTDCQRTPPCMALLIFIGSTRRSPETD